MIEGLDCIYLDLNLKDGIFFDFIIFIIYNFISVVYISRNKKN